MPTRRIRSGRLPVMRRGLEDRRRSLIGWALGIGGYAGVMTAFWTAIKGNSAISDAIKNYPDVMKKLFGGVESFDFSKPGNYLNAELFSLMMPLLMAVFAIGFAASTLAGEEQGGQLDMLLAAPVSRKRVVTEKALTLVAAVAGLAGVTWLAMVLVGALNNLGVSMFHLAAACAGSALVALAYGSIAFVTGAATGSRAFAISAATATFAVGYLCQVLASLVSSMHPARMASALWLANDSLPVNHGFPIVRDLILLAVIAICLTAARRLFDRRNLAA
jgi:ABC-2 type transport system permease protein